MQTRVERNRWLKRFAWVAMACLGVVAGHANAQDQVVTSRACHFDKAAPVIGPACLLARVSVGALPAEPVYWHLDTFANVAAANAAKDARSVVVQDYGKIWLFTIAKAVACERRHVCRPHRSASVKAGAGFRCRIHPFHVRARHHGTCAQTFRPRSVLCAGRRYLP